MYRLSINGEEHSVDVGGATPLLWVVRETLQLTGTKFGCGIGQCGACTVHLNGEPVRSCMISVESIRDGEITTIEGLSPAGKHPLQIAWAEEQVVQCGYCQTGQIMQAATLLSNNANPSDEEIVQHMDGNLCRCGTYHRIKRAIKRAAEYKQRAEL